MSSHAIPESPTARLLLELAARRASCEVPFGERTVVLFDGAIVDVRGKPEDVSLTQFLVAAGRIDEREREQVERRIRERGVSLDQALGELESLEPEALFDTRRALLLDRLVRAIAAHESEEQSSGPRAPETAPLSAASHGPAFDATALVLDALARRAAFGAAEVVGSLRRARFVWVEAPEQKRAAIWAELGDIPHAMSVATLFPRHPAAPSRIAALVRAGVARLDAGSSSGAPTARQSVVASSRPPPTRVITDPPPEPARPITGPLGIVPVASWLPAATSALADPLLPLEARVKEREAAGAPAPERATAWLALADGWRLHQHSTAEATRAAREAAAASPSDPRALASAATLTAATGAPDLAYAYALAWSNCAPTPEERARALFRAADYARRASLPSEMLEALRRGVDNAPEDPVQRELLARCLARRGELQPAVEHARKVAELLRATEPERARSVLAWAASIAPTNLRTWNDLAKMLVRTGRSKVGIAVLAHAARMQTDSAVRERLRLSAVAFAELAASPDSASELLLEAVDTGSALVEPLVAQLHASGAWVELAIVAEQLAMRVRGSERAVLLMHAAEAREKMPHGQDAGLELLSEALCADPESNSVFNALVTRVNELGRPQVLVDALERAVRAQDRAGAGSKSPDAAEVQRRAGALLLRLRELPSEASTAPLAQFTAERLAALEGHVLSEDTQRALAGHRERFEAVAQKLERELRAADPAERTVYALRLAALCRQDPPRRTTARKLYEKVLEREPGQPDALRGLETLLRLEGDEHGLDALAERRSRTQNVASAHLSLAYREQRAGRLDGALAACAAALACTGNERELEREARVLQWRVAQALGDPTQVERALRGLANAASDGRERAALLMRLVRVQRAAGALEEGVASAEAALECEPTCAEAALVLLDEVPKLATAPKIEVLRAMRKVLGDTPELLRQLARACFAAADPQGQREALEALLALAPDDGFAARALVALRTTGRDAGALRDAIKSALEPRRFGSQTLAVVQQGLTRLAALSGLDAGMELVLAAMEQLGEQARPLLAWAGEHALELKSLPLRGAVLEQLVAHASSVDRPLALRQLAALRREQGSAWASARAELRLLALRPDDTSALERLATLYAETGEAQRLDAALDLLCERAGSDEERRMRLLDRAASATQFAHDTEAAAGFVERAFGSGDSELSIPVLQRGLGLLLSHVPERAFALLLSLAPRSGAGRSRELLEEALVLAEGRIHKPALALSAASQGALRHPTYEPFVEALDRLACASGQVDLLVATLEEAAERCDVMERQATLLLRAAKLSEDELDDGVRACVLLDRAYRATPTDAIEELVLAGAGRLFARDVRAGKFAYDRMRDTLHVRAKFGQPLARARALMTLSRLSLDVYLHREDALRYADAVQGALAVELPEDERAQVLAELDALRAQLERSSELVRPVSRAPLTSKKTLSPEQDVPFAGMHHNAPTFRPTSGALSQSPSPPVVLVPAARTVVPSAESQAPRIAIMPIELRGHNGVASLSLEHARPVHRAEGPRDRASLIGAVAAGESAALTPFAELLVREAEHAATICAELLERVRAQSFSICALRGLRLSSAATNAHALWRTSSQALAFVEPPLRPPGTQRRRDVRGPLAQAGLHKARESDQSEALALLGQLVEAAAPLFRRPLTGLPGVGKELESLRDAPYAPLLAELAQLFELKHDAYLARSGEDRVSIASAQPAALIVGDRTPPETSSLRFRFARAFEYARPENVLFVTQSAQHVEALLSAVAAAFAPADHSPAKVSREAATLAAELWRTMPSKAQRALASQLKLLPTPLAYEPLLASVRLRGLRVALFATRELDVALAQLGHDGDPEGSAIERSEGGFNRALADQPLTRALMAYAFSHAYLAAGSDEQ
ncbi:MAG: hypothetical protein RLZZ450_2791 [Pseudomonadota bacterium]|jgi:hypothetical protein